MKNVNYILYIEPDRTSDDAGPCGQRSAGDKVVDLAAWKEEHLADLDVTETDGLLESDPEQYEDRKQIRRQHRRPAVDWAELAATLAVAVACLALAARVLLF